MRFLGFIFIVVLILGVVGYFRDWFSVSTSHASGKSDVTLEVDSEKLAADAKAAADGVAVYSGKAVEGVKSMVGKSTAEATELEGTVTAIDAAARDLVVTVDAKKHDVHVPSGVPVTRAGDSIGFEALRAGARVKLSFSHAGDVRTLTRIAILP